VSNTGVCKNGNVVLLFAKRAKESELAHLRVALLAKLC
jgi:hypothetical protein